MMFLKGRNGFKIYPIAFVPRIINIQRVIPHILFD